MRANHPGTPDKSDKQPPIYIAIFMIAKHFSSMTSSLHKTALRFTKRFSVINQFLVSQYKDNITVLHLDIAPDNGDYPRYFSYFYMKTYLSTH